MKRMMLALLILIPGISAANPDEIKTNYTINYIEQLTPILRDKLVSGMPGVPADKVSKQVEVLIVKMADCQFSSIKHYPKKYWDMAVLPVAAGENLLLNNKKIDTFFESEIKKGKISVDEVVELVEKAQKHLRACMSS